MKHFFLGLVIVLMASCQSISTKRFTKEIELYRAEYQKEFLHTDRSPLEQDDLKYLDFFEPDSKYRVNARVALLEEQDTLILKTSAGKFKKYIPYARLDFKLDRQMLQLYAYTSLDLMNNETYKDYLFIPFTDATSGEDTYGGGRYLDLNSQDIQKNRIILDFNKAYNPWCAFSDGYNCPVPPLVNDLPLKVEAGEKKFKAAPKKK